MAYRDDDIEFLALAVELWKYKYFVLITAIVGAAIAAGVGLLMTPVFRAEVMITEVKEDSLGGLSSLAQRLGGLADVAGMGLGSGAGGDRESQAVLRSRRLVEEFIQRNDLVALMSKDRPAAKPSTKKWFAVRHFQKGVLSIRDDKRAGVTVIAVDWTDADTAARWANEFVALANDVIRTRAMQESQRSIEYLNDQLTRINVVELRRVMYNLIESQAKTLMLANARAEYAFTVVDPAVAPEIRQRPRRTLMVIVGFGLGVFFGVIVGFIHNSLKGRKRDKLRTA
jgi:uncharacterized protein involved in exopolysaccharide biosynthesis